MDLARLDKIRFLLIVVLSITVVLELPAAFIIIPSLSIVLLGFQERFFMRRIPFKVSGQAYFLVLIFVVHALWFLWMILSTGSTRYLERTLPFLLFPLMISSTPVDARRLSVIYKAFMISVGASYTMSLIAAVYHYHYSVPKWGRPSDFFFHEQLTQGLFNIHPTYYSLMGCLATLLALFTLKGIWRAFAVTFFTVVILMINARITLIIQLLLIFSFFISGFSKGFSVRRLVILAVSGVALLVSIRVFNSIYDYPHRKILVNLDSAWQRSFAPDVYDGDGGVAIRMAIWRNAYEIIREHPLLGVGLGFEDEALVQKYNKRGMAYLAGDRFNAHNQALSYLVTMGIVGFALLTFIYLKLISDAYSKRCFVYLGFIILFLCVGLTESVFNRLLGVSMFALFNTLFILKVVHHDK